jgi:hypothetical protein
MKLNRIVRGLACVLVYVGSTPVRAQPTNVVLSWQFSQDAGTTWMPDALTIETLSPASVLVRGVVSWQQSGELPEGFYGMNFDPFVARAARSGPQDWIVDPLFRVSSGLAPRPGWIVTALPDLLKVDHESDTSAPGVGARWGAASQTPVFEGWTMDNPIEIIRYTYLLDGSAGVREVSAALLVSGSGMSSAFIDWDVGPSTPMSAPASVLPGTITVIPAPGSSVLLVAGLGLATRRRRP